MYHYSVCYTFNYETSPFNVLDFWYKPVFIGCIQPSCCSGYKTQHAFLEKLKRKENYSTDYIYISQCVEANKIALLTKIQKVVDFLSYDPWLLHNKYDWI